MRRLEGKGMIVNKRQAMWQVVRMRRVLNISDLQEIATVSKSYAVTFLNLLVSTGIAKKLASGKYRLLSDPVKLPFEVALHYEKKDLNLVKTSRPEDAIWKKIISLAKAGKEFLYEDLTGQGLRPTQIRHYVSALYKAGYVKKCFNKGNGDNCARYQLVKNTGDYAPILGRTAFLWDRNTDAMWTQAPDRSKFLKGCLTQRREGAK